MPTKGFRLNAMKKSRLQQQLEAAIGDRSVYQVAREWDIPHWVIYGVLSGGVDCPGPKYLRQVARALDTTIEAIIDAAYSEPTPA